jgi:NADH-quinone oxidoreductase subunit N
VDAKVVDALTGFVPQLLPEIVLAVAACVLFLGGTWRGGRCLWGWAALVSLGLAALGLWRTQRTVSNVGGESSAIRQLAEEGAKRDISDQQRAKVERDRADWSTAFNARLYSAPILHTALGNFVRWFALAIGAVLVLFAWHELPDGHASEYHACLLLMVAGTGLTAAANDLVTLFLALELTSIPTYIILYLPRADPSPLPLSPTSGERGRGEGPAQEAALKYFLLSVFSSALLLFGFSYLYGLGGTTNLAGLAAALGQPDHPAGASRGVLLVALVLVLAGLGFRITAVPFHFYAPDVYQGTATPNAALLAVIPKVAGFVALIRVLVLVQPVSALAELGTPIQPFGIPGYDVQVPVVLWIMAAVTMSLGNVLALLQDNIKRLLAYSSVSHAGYMLIGLTAAARLRGEGDPAIGGVEGVLFYLVAYAAMTTGAFAILSHLSTPEKPVETADDLAGLGRHRPGSALLMTLFLLSLIGIPLTAGFAGKLFLFLGAMQTPLALTAASPAVVHEQEQLFNILVLIAVVNAAIGGWYYLRLIAYMYLRESAKGPPAHKPRPVLGAVWVCAVVTLFAGVYPDPLLDTVKAAVRVRPAAKADGAPTAQR